jgi:membrane-associated HD superfamily phosphohydrolase
VTPQKPLKPPVISYASVAPSEEFTPKNENVFVPSGAKMAAKKTFPQPVADFLLKHVGFSLKEWLDQVKPEHKQAFLDNLALILQTADTKSLTDDQLKKVVTAFAEEWIASVKYEADLQIKTAQEKQLRFTTLVSVGFGLLTTLMILCLILVLLAIERNTRLSGSQKSAL